MYSDFLYSSKLKFGFVLGNRETRYKIYKRVNNIQRYEESAVSY